MNTRKTMIMGKSGPGLDAQMNKAMADGASSGFIFEGQVGPGGDRRILIRALQPNYSCDMQDVALLRECLDKLIKWAKTGEAPV